MTVENLNQEDLNQKDLLETYHMLIEQLRFEGELIWTRHQVFIVLNSVIFAGISLSNRPNISISRIDIRIVYAAATFGVILCVLWFLTTLRSQVYYRYWISQARAVESQMTTSLPVLRDLHLAHQGKEVDIGGEKFRFNPIERFASISRISRLVAIAFFAIWIGLAVAFSS